VPLLLIPPFPFCNLSLGHLVKPLSEPNDATAEQPFHLVIPSLPGLGFSDPLPNNTPIMFTCAEILDTLMRRLSYPHYLATNSGAASMSPAEIDWKLINMLATHYPDSCLGTHFISPPLVAPKITEAPWEWTKWSLANFFHAGILGYSDDDFAALERIERPYDSWSSGSKKRPPTPQQFGLNKLGLKEPNTLAYALCDSPTGLLVFVMKALRTLGPRTNFTPEQIITFTELAWLPGPEYAMRFWAHCATHEENEKDKTAKKTGGQVTKPRVAITVFTGGKDYTPSAALSGGEAPAGTQEGDVEMAVLPPALPSDDKQRYICPAWGNAHYNVVHTQRATGKPGLLAWERPEVIAAGVRGLAREILRVDKRIAPASPISAQAATAATTTAPLQQVVVIPASEGGSGSGNGTGGNVGESPSSPTPTPSPAQRLRMPPVITTEEPPHTDGYVRPALVKPSVSGETAVGTEDSEEKVPDVKGKGKELEVPPRDPFYEGNSPDTLVSTPPLAKAGGLAPSPLKTPSPLPSPAAVAAK
jgi:pimeloyl-ACP methyl ester carboxylesterase